MKKYLSISLIAASLLLCSCEGVIIPGIEPIDPSEPADTTAVTPPEPEEPEEPKLPSVDLEKTGISYIYDMTQVPEIHVRVSQSEWNRLLSMYDANNKTKQFVTCDVTYTKGTETKTIRGAGLRLRGNTSRRRPEGWQGMTHSSSYTDWHHCHFGLNFRKYTKDDAHEVHGARKVNLKWHKDDPNYVREMYCYELFRRDSVWTAPFSSYCRLWINVEGDAKEAYFGVYEQVEPVDTRYLKARQELFGSADGNLWKCRWGARLNSTDANFGVDDGSDAEYTYELKSDYDFNAAKEQLQDFILKLTGKGEDSFYKWIQEVCDVPLLLRTYAVNVAVGMWDDYWSNCNNFYIYFNSTDKYAYKFYFIPYDYDNTLGTSMMMDSGRQDPFNWGDNTNLLIYRILKFEDFREIYRQALLELVDEQNALLYYTASIERIKQWQEMVRPYVKNDTNEDCDMYDSPAYWGNHSEYKLLDTGSNNYFKVKTQSIKQYCK